MTQIERKVSINGRKLTQEIIDNLSAQSIAASPKEVQSYFYENEGYTFDPYNSVVLFERNSLEIYGYILAHGSNIQNIDIVFEGSESIIDYLKQSHGLYISNVVLQSEIKDTPLILLLNTLHGAYCESDLTKSGLYIWMNYRECLFAETRQEEPFYLYALNKVSRTFYDKCI